MMSKTGNARVMTHVNDMVLYAPADRPAQLDVSVILCTRNRVDALRDALDSLAAAIQASGNVSAEIVLVDSASTDATPDLLRSWAESQSFPVVAIRCLLPGLARARNAGLSQSRGAIIAMTDDDCVVAADYLDKIKAAFASESGPAIIGGRINLGDTRDLPITIKPDPEPKVFDKMRMPSGFIMGANLSFNRRVIKELGEFDVRFGAGARFVSAEDSDLLVRARIKGIRVRYAPEIVVSHFHGRRQLSDAQKLNAGYSFGDGALFAKHLFATSFIARAIIGALARSARDLVLPSNDPILGRRKHLFRLKHQFRGFAAFLRTRNIPEDGAFKAG
ncbi:glycosyltransferase family 2 protein [Caulobacter hibisci]|uniref:Glycosyltransferase n=1 Tax=Caulobacter hibisci TaxID=2035993 RepID=A0ABS0T577_9CAUL|nr:glycosyltransferase family 2 protein [Caulobacter hibisci]MBI1687009.1 glycosyltransferase [Caulobacter hibisci]